MKAGTEKKKLIVLGVLMMIAIPVALYNFEDMLWPSQQATTLTMATRAGSVQTRQTAEVVLTADSSSGLDLDALAASRKIAYQLGRNIFDVQPLAKEIVPEAKDSGHQIEPQPPTQNIIPSMPVKFYGFAKKQGIKKRCSSRTAIVRSSPIRAM